MKRFETPAGCTIIVGSNATENDKVTFELGEPDDWWFHAQGSPGAHVLLKGQDASPECMQMAPISPCFTQRGTTKLTVQNVRMFKKQKHLGWSFWLTGRRLTLHDKVFQNVEYHCGNKCSQGQTCG